jgi:DNA polymerase-1
MNLIVDIETDGLLKDVTRAWLIGYQDLDTGDVRYWLDGDEGWKVVFDSCTMIIGHNIASFDLMVLEKLFGYKLPKHVKVVDTMIWSLILNYNRFPMGRHSLANWGESLGSNKIEFDDFSHYSEEMLTYWKQDLNVTEKVYKVVLKEYKQLFATHPRIKTYLQAETAVATWCGRAELYGWPFDLEAAIPLLAKMEAERQVCSDRLMPKLGTKTVAIDRANGEVKPKIPKWRKDGAYDSHTCRWFGIDEWSGQDEDRLVEGPYSRIEFRHLDVNSVSDVKIFLFRHGWIPTEYNTKDIPDPNRPGRFIKERASPKITEDSLECMEGDGKLYCDFLTTSSRAAILKGWIANTDAAGRLHGECFTIGTPSFRARHSVIVNVPAADSAWGKSMRALFTVTPGWKMIGADSAGNQARGLAHYLKSPEYVDLLLNGDIHTFNANAIDTVLKEMKIDWTTHLLKQGTKEDELAKKKRGIAKRVLYATLFGASGLKLWSYIFSTQDELKGKKLKIGFLKAIPGFKALSDKLENVFGKTKQYGDGYIPGIAGNRIYCTSFHKLLVYLLQACEKATCSAALMITMQNLEKAGIPYQPLIYYHDEIDFMVPEQYTVEAMKISKEAFKEGPKLFNVMIMDGEAKQGLNWEMVH